MTGPYRPVNGAHRAYADRNRSWRRVWLWPAVTAVVVLGPAGVFVATRTAQPPSPVSAAAGAQPGPTPTVPTTTYAGQNVDEDGPAETTTKGCAP